MTEISKMSDKQLADLAKRVTDEQHQREAAARERRADYWRENFEGQYILVGEDLYFIRKVEDEYRCDAVCLLHNSDQFERNPEISFKHGTIYGFFNEQTTKSGKNSGKSIANCSRVISKEEALQLIEKVHAEMLKKFEMEN